MIYNNMLLVWVILAIPVHGRRLNSLETLYMLLVLFYFTRILHIIHCLCCKDMDTAMRGPYNMKCPHLLKCANIRIMSYTYVHCTRPRWHGSVIEVSVISSSRFLSSIQKSSTKISFSNFQCIGPKQDISFRCHRPKIENCPNLFRGVHEVSKCPKDQNLESKVAV